MVRFVHRGDPVKRWRLALLPLLDRIFVEAQFLSLFPVESMPFSINRGQTDVVPISLTFTNESTSDASDVRIERLQLGLEEESGAGVVPSAVLSRVVVNEGTTVYLEKSSLETSGSLVDLLLTQPIVIESGGRKIGEIDGKLIGFGYNAHIYVNEPDLADNRRFLDLLTLFASSVGYHRSMRRNIKRRVRAIKRGAPIEHVVEDEEFWLLKNPRRVAA